MTSSSSSSYTGAFDGDDGDSSRQRRNPFVGSDNDVMAKVRYRLVDNKDSSNYKSTSSLKSTTSSDDGFIDEQFLHRKSTKIPYKAIGLAIFLFCLGTVMCVIGGMLLSGIYIDQKYNDRTWPVLFLGLIMFIPGVYHVRIAYYAYKQVPGFEYSDIPDWD